MTRRTTDPPDATSRNRGATSRGPGVPPSKVRARATRPSGAEGADPSVGGFAGDLPEEFVRELHAMLTTLVQRTPIFAEMRRRGLAEDLVQETLLAVTGRMRAGQAIDDPRTYATACVTNLARRTFAQAQRESAVGAEAIEAIAPCAEDVADRVERRAAVGEVLEMVRAVNGVLAGLDPQQLELVRAELARTDQKKLAAHLGISRPTLYRRKGPAIAAFVSAVAARAGTSPCPEHAGALLAAAGQSNFDGARAAAAHATTCPECAETLRHLAVARHGLAILSPLPILTTSGHDVSRTAERLHAVFDTGVDTVRNLLLRVGDPTPLGGSATKTAAIVAAACTGGGGIYCAVDGVPAPLRAPFERKAEPRAGAAKPKTTAARVLVPVRSTTRSVLVPTAVTGVAQGTGTAVQGGGVTTHRTAVKAAARTRALRAAAAKRRAAAVERAAAAARTQAAREFATAAPAATGSAATGEFAAPAAAPTPAATITRREFATPSGGGSSVGGGGGSGSQVQREFGAP